METTETVEKENVPSVKGDYPNGVVVNQDGTVVLDGFVVPHLTVSDYGCDGQSVLVVVDGRMGYRVQKDQLWSVIPLVANAMAVSCGYSAFGENSRLVNPFQNHAGWMPVINQHKQAS